jgi:hypothetical protein
VFHTELGHDIDVNDVFFDQRTDYLLGPSGSTRLGVQTRYEHGAWTFMIVCSITELFSHDNGEFHRITDQGITPDFGAVHGKVFVDADADGKLGDDEQGVPDVRVVTPQGFSAKTDKNGYYAIQAGPRARTDRVFLDMGTVPADLTPTNGVQSAQVGPRRLTRVNLGLSPLHDVSGLVYWVDKGDTRRPLAGLRVFITKQGDATVLTDSYTASDGSYYLGNLRPGTYVVNIDVNSLPSDLTISDLQRLVTIPASAQAQDIKPPPFETRLAPGATGRGSSGRQASKSKAP